jgi:4-amino-4-deoxy-L-arabinose transferase-like glycosyltransferase
VSECTAIPSSSIETQAAFEAPWPRYLKGLMGVAFAIGLLLRLISFHSHPYDNHSFRQCQTLSTIDDFYRNGIDILHPRTLYMGHPGVFVLELPVFQAIGATIYKAFGPHLELIRTLNICIGAATAWILYLLTSHFLYRTTAVFAALIYWLAPLNVLYHRSTLLDPLAVLCGLTAFYSLAILLAGARQDGSIKNRSAYFFIFATAALLTALIKALYLWPAVLLFGHGLLKRRFKLDAALLSIAAAFAVAGICLICWNRYAASVNHTNPLTGGISPISLLGISELLDPPFYLMMVKTRAKAWLGLVGGLFYLFALWVSWMDWRKSGWRSPLFLIAIIPPTYLLAFSNINFPHDYYQLIVTPFLAMTSGVGISWSANWLRATYSKILVPRFLATSGCLLGIAAILTYAVWFKWPYFDSRLLAFQNLCDGKLEPWASAILWGTPEATGQTNNYLPSFLYAGRLWGYGWTVRDAASAHTPFKEIRAGFDRLDYVVFYGTEEPEWMSGQDFQLKIRDEEHHFFVFQSMRKSGLESKP